MLLVKIDSCSADARENKTRTDEDISRLVLIRSVWVKGRENSEHPTNGYIRQIAHMLRSRSGHTKHQKVTTDLIRLLRSLQRQQMPQQKKSKGCRRRMPSGA